MNKLKTLNGQEWRQHGPPVHKRSVFKFVSDTDYNSGCGRPGSSSRNGGVAVAAAAQGAGVKKLQIPVFWVAVVWACVGTDNAA